MGKMWDGGRDREGIELVEYCDKRFLDACDIGRGRMLLRAGGAGGEVISGGRAGCDVFAAGEGITGGDVAGEELGDMIAVMIEVAREDASEPGESSWLRLALGWEEKEVGSGSRHRLQRKSRVS